MKLFLAAAVVLAAVATVHAWEASFLEDPSWSVKGPQHLVEERASAHKLVFTCASSKKTEMWRPREPFDRVYGAWCRIICKKKKARNQTTIALYIKNGTTCGDGTVCSGGECAR
uniref:ADAM cysteine-rich domain n=1 Tax=Argas monolakensis TaxID=34602 RepID=Q09JP1_ARGMO|nr:ADAM cysteine-rich domain [Argas monolakensis]